MPTLKLPPRSIAVRAAKIAWAGRHFNAALRTVIEQYTLRITQPPKEKPNERPLD